MTEQDVLRQLRVIRFRPSVTTVARQAGVDRGNLYRQIIAGRLTPRYKWAVEQVLLQMDESNGYQNRPPPQPREAERRSAQAADPRR